MSDALNPTILGFPEHDFPPAAVAAIQNLRAAAETVLATPDPALPASDFLRRLAALVVIAGLNGLSPEQVRNSLQATINATRDGQAAPTI